MTDSAIDSKNASKPAPDMASEAQKRAQSWQESQAREEGGPGQEVIRKTEGAPHQQEGGCDRYDEASERRPRRPETQRMIPGSAGD